MPVPDRPVHERTKVGHGHKPGCWNAPRPKTEGDGGGYYAPDRRYHDDGTFTVEQSFIPHRMSTECRYDQAINPEGCDGCWHLGSGKRYAETINQGAKK